MEKYCRLKCIVFRLFFVMQFKCGVLHYVTYCLVVSVVGRINEVNQHRARLVHDG